jgi:hypothetical protein
MSGLQRAIFWLSGLGLSLLLLGLITLALPIEEEGPELVRLNAQHSITLLDLLSTGLTGVGSALIFLSATLWTRYYGSAPSDPKD